MEQDKLSHLDKDGSANMVDISEKNITTRAAYASCVVFLSEKAYQLVKKNQIEKGNVLNIAKIAAISASKKTHDLIPLCHQIPLSKVDVEFILNDEKNTIKIQSTALTDWKTGVEMEALTAVSIASLTIYDMCKSVDKSIKITDIKLDKKTGGKSGSYIRE
ncbi:MAG: cyclic pyranopterin monophosphate synthase MoaC [Chloroflexota bacterium]|jgi:molybdenum cofactor biosynthesis protein MoaC|nr:cyclic pyranopterin monophosphate synthase MoaC [Chloroflexota bacterium]MEC9107491.1 cyclic pyranopterin monophosphate synthase MoaC [Chloroflexota bacterium]MED5237406.1 cyclic pyranopterin monophosphate synthase MoaC [Chloroflexota bacterium]MED5255332.1 cyclic pyranopterin monophosphate synthase MoaC [Chloroflexota bacterium]MQG44022.1 cyclic pyranopterin monophosphate synthase MoaC [SAR202 cluster bacterium]|tara:strand:- start:2931 stop:3413 length:483 start_codon:yes stop_codon:yes gene_type:complete